MPQSAPPMQSSPLGAYESFRAATEAAAASVTATHPFLVQAPSSWAAHTGLASSFVDSWLVRADYDTATSTYLAVGAAPLSNLAAFLDELQFSHSVLSEAVHSLLGMRDYGNLYISYLLHQIDLTTFQEKSALLACHTVRPNISEATRKLEALRRLLPDRISIDDAAEIFCWDDDLTGTLHSATRLALPGATAE